MLEVNFRERRKGEVRRITLPRTPVNKEEQAPPPSPPRSVTACLAATLLARCGGVESYSTSEAPTRGVRPCRAGGFHMSTVQMVVMDRDVARHPLLRSLHTPEIDVAGRGIGGRQLMLPG
jgi:hypothetical protein